MNRQTIHLCSRHRRWQNYQQILKNQELEIASLKEKVSELGGSTSGKVKSAMGSMNVNLLKLENQNKELRSQLKELEELKNFSFSEMNSFEIKMMGILEQNKEKNKEVIIQLFNYLNNRQEIVSQLQNDIGDLKNIFEKFSQLLKKGPIQFTETHESINLLKGILQNFFSKLNDDIMGKKVEQFREIFKINKKEILNSIKDQYTINEKLHYQQEFESLKKERQLLSSLPDKIKQLIQGCRDREENYKHQIDLLQKHIKESETVHLTVVQKYEEMLNSLSEKYNNSLNVYARDMVHPTNELKIIIQNQVNYIHESFEKMIQNYDLKGIVSSLNDIISRYLEYKKTRSDQTFQKLNKKIGQSFIEISEKSKVTIDQIKQLFDKENIDFGSSYREIDAKIKEIEASVSTQRKKGVELELQNRINCQKEYIVLLEQYNTKLESCIKRMGVDNPIEEEWKSIVKQIDQKHNYFERQSEALRTSNQQLISALVQTKQILSANFKKNQDIFNLFKLFQIYSEQIQRLKLQTFNYFETEINFQKQIEFQTFSFNEAFFNPSSKLMKVSQKLPIFKIPTIVKQTQIGHVLKQTYQEQLEKYSNIRKQHQILFKNKKTIEIRLEKLLSEVLKLHGEYLKTVVDRDKEVEIKLDEKMIKNISTYLTFKLEDSLSSIKVLRESLIKAVGEIKKQFELSNKQMKTLMIYLRGSKLQKSVSDLTKTLGFNMQKINNFNQLLNSLFEQVQRKSGQESLKK